MKLTINISKLLIPLIILLIVFSNPPWPFFGIYIYFVAAITLVLCFLVAFSSSSANKRLLYALPIILISFFYFGVFKALDEFRFSTILFFLVYVCLFFINDDIKKRSFSILTKTLGYIVAISLLSWLVNYFIFELPFGFPLAYSDLLGKGEGLIFKNYILFIQPDMDYFRFYSVFDEPGVLGTLSAIILLGNKYDFKKKENLFLLFGGIFTFSLAFYIVTILGYLINAVIMRRIKQVVIISTILLSILPFLLTLDAFKLSIVYRLSNFNQSVQDRNGVLLDQFYDAFSKTPKLYYGESLTFFANNPLLHEGSSYKFFIIEYGFIGFLLLLLLYIFLIDFKRINFYIIFCLIVFLILFIQRPFMYTPWSILLFSLITANSYKAKG